MEKITVMVNGLPGKMAEQVAVHAARDPHFRLVPYSLTGPEISQPDHTVEGSRVRLIGSERADREIAHVIKTQEAFITVDFTHPTAVRQNARLYCRNNLPFVMGTTGGDRKGLETEVIQSDNCAVIAPNMAKQIVGLQAMMAYAADNFPDLFSGYTLEVRESHQKGKADTSGTAIAMINYFNAMGIPFSIDAVKKERDPQIQKNQWGIPEEYLSGHAWHTYRLVSEDNTVVFEFTHNVNGRDIYAKGTLDAVSFLHRKVGSGESGKVYDMMDVLKKV
ncbi:MAG: dihydrodipicolinate reductase [Desulfobacterales bacterium]